MDFEFRRYPVTVSHTRLDLFDSPGSFIPNASFTGIVPSNLTLCLKKIKISKPLKDYIDKKLSGEKFLKIGWTFHNLKDLFQIATPLYDNLKFKLDRTGQYPLEVDEKFIHTLNKNPVVLTLYVTDKKTVASVSRAELDVSDIIDNVNKKGKAKLLFYHDKVSREHVSQLELWYKFSCNKRDIQELLTRCNMCNHFHNNRIKLSELMPTRERCVNRTQEDEVTNNLLSSLAEAKMVMAHTENKNAKKEKVRMRYEDNSKKNGDKSLIDVDWMEWMKPGDFQKKDRLHQNPGSEDVKHQMSITIVKLYFLESNISLREKSIEQIYVEYSFLGNDGPEMETPFTVPVGFLQEPAEFNWTKTFEFSIEKNYALCKSLVDFISDDRTIRFTVISEPRESFNNVIQTCEEVGYAEVSLKDVIELPNNSDTYQYEILDFEKPLVVIGYIVICFDGILSVQNLVSCLKSPKKVRRGA